MSYNYSYHATDGDAVGAIITLAINFLTGGGFALIAYILRSWALYAIASRRQLRHPWLAWVPVADVWLLGCISDQYQYVVRGHIRSRRRVLLVLNIVTIVLSLVTAGLAITSVAGIIGGVVSSASGAEIFSAMTGLLLATAGVALPLAVISIILAVYRFIALYDLYVSCSPQNATLFILLSILFRVTEPFFLFFNRDRDDGMPPRRPAPAACPPQEPAYDPADLEYHPVREPWEEGE